MVKESMYPTGPTITAMIKVFCMDRSLQEAGMVDGITNRWQELWYIVLPSMKPVLLFGAIMAITGAFSISGSATW